MPTALKPATGRYVYVLAHETWYAHPDTEKSIAVLHLEDDGGCRWEFEIRPLHVEALRVEVEERNWTAFGAVPELFAALGALVDSPEGRNAAPVNEIRDLLDQLGFADITPRTDDGDHPAPVAWRPGDLEEFAEHFTRSQNG